MHLNDEQIQYGFYYYFQERKDDIARVTEVSQYGGEEKLIINCTQLGSTYKSQNEKKRVLAEWCDFLIENPTAFKLLKFGTRMPQALLDAVCRQKELEQLEIKWGAYNDISAIQELKKLKLLYIGSGAGVESIRPLSKLSSLIGLYVENFQKVRDYSELASLNALESLTICGDGMSPKYITLDSIEFLRRMPQLRFLRLLTIRLQSKDYTPILELQELEHLSLGSHRDVKKAYDALCRLPKLKWGLLKDHPESYMK